MAANTHAVGLRALVCTLVLLIAVNTTAWGDSLLDGFAAYEDGDFQSAYRIWKPLAEQGDAFAQFHLGSLYRNGQGVPQDFVEAANWYRLAAEQGHDLAQGVLGGLYIIGQGVPQNYKESLRWFSLSAEQGSEIGQVGLSWLYSEGKGVQRDLIQAHKWANLSAAQGNETATQIRDAVASEMSASQIEDAQRLAREWLETHLQ